MGQQEIYDWLKARRASGDDRFFTPLEIYAEAGNGYRVDGFRRALMRLYLNCGEIEVKVSEWGDRRGYRCKHGKL